MNKKWLKVINISLTVFIVLNVLFIFYSNNAKFLTFNYWETFEEQKKVFYDSQYKNKNHTGFIPDELAYAYTGGALIRGENPVFNVPEAPPLGKYLIGLSAVLFNNPNILIVGVAGILGLVMLFLVSRQVFGNSFISLLPVAIMVSEPLYRNQYKYVPLFDLAHLLFLLTAVYFFNKAFAGNKRPLLNFALSGLFVGFFIATKFYTAGVPVIAAFLIVLLLNKNWLLLFKYVSTLWIPVAVLLATYLRVFAFGYNIRSFLGIQKWIFHYWQGALVVPFTAWDLLLFNRWHTGPNNDIIQSDQQWHIIWPIITVLTAIAIVLYIMKKLPRKKELEFMLAFAITYGAFMSAGKPTVRYFIIYLPFLYIISLYLIQHLVVTYVQPKIQKKRIIERKKTGRKSKKKI